MVLQQEGSKVASRVAVPRGVATLQEGFQQGAQLPEDKREVEQTQAEVVLQADTLVANFFVVDAAAPGPFCAVSDHAARRRQRVGFALQQRLERE